MGKLALAVNSGSSSIKFALYPVDRLTEPLLHGQAKLSSSPSLSFVVRGEEHEQTLAKDKEYEETFQEILELITADKWLEGREIELSAHRIVHGGDETEPVVIHPGRKEDEQILKKMDSVSDLAPLHNHHAMLSSVALSFLSIHCLLTMPGRKVVRAILKALPKATCVLTFDTLFHASLPKSATTYFISKPKHPTPVPLRRYGFHGLSYAYITRKMAELKRKSRDDLNLVIAHLGSGGSACLVIGGKSTETTMGCTPLEGLPGGTRSGTLDPSLIFHHTPDCSDEVDWSGRKISKAEYVLNKESGFQALCGTNDFGVITQRAFSDDDIDCSAEEKEQARLAYDAYLQRLMLWLAHYVSSAMNAPGGLDALVFSGGIGEHSSLLRKEVVGRFGWVEQLAKTKGGIDEQANERGKGTRQITKQGSTIEAWIVETNEEEESIMLAVNAVKH